MKKFLVLFAVSSLIPASLGYSQNTTWSYDFGTNTGTWTTGASTNGFLPAPEAGGGTNVVRIGTGSGQFQLVNPGGGSYLTATAATNASINKLSFYNFNNPTTAFTLSFDLTLSGGASGEWYLFAGNGVSFESSTASFTGAQSFVGLRFVYGASDAISVSNRAAGSWVALSGTGIGQNTNYSISIYGNNDSLNSIVYGTNTLAPNTFDLWVSDTKVGAGLAKAQLTNDASIDSFMFYGQSSAANAATVQLDNISYSNYAVPEPSTYAMLALAGAGFAGYVIRRRRR